MLIRIPNILTAAQLTACRTALQIRDWTDGRATAGALTKAVKNNLQLRRAIR
jgi:PKHD-type hydroxylase